MAVRNSCYQWGIVLQLSPNIDTLVHDYSCKDQIGQRYDPANYMYRTVSLTFLHFKLLEHVVVSNVIKQVDQQDPHRQPAWFPHEEEMWDTTSYVSSRSSLCDGQGYTRVYKLIWSSLIFPRRLVACLINAFSGNSISTALEDTLMNGYHRSSQAEHRAWLLKESRQKVYQLSVVYHRVQFWDPFGSES